MDRSNAGPAFIPPVHHLTAKQLGSPSSSSSSAPSQNNTRYATRPSHQHYQVPDNHFDIISDEIQAALLDPPSSRRTHIIRDRIAALELTDFGGAIDWEKELMAFAPLDFPEYYRQPFHSVPGGWLSKRAAVYNRMAMQSIYREAHPHSCSGLRGDLVQWVPMHSKFVVDLGTGDGDGAATTAKLRPAARVVGVDASPFMIIAGRRQNREVANLEWRHALAERTGLSDGCADAVTITLVLHECSDEAKLDIAREAARILKPGGVLVVADTPQDDLATYRGFYEPHREAWAKFDPHALFEAAGLVGVSQTTILGGDLKAEADQRAAFESGNTDNRLFVITATKPEHAKL